MTLVVPTSMRAESERAERSIPRLRVNSGDASIDRRGRVRNVPPILSYGFRPFFLLGSIYAAFAVPFWLFAYFGGVAPAGPFPGLAWHAHEMVFGYLGAVMAGFILTAVPNWTGRLPLSGAPLAALVGLWLVGRMAVAGNPEPVSAAVIDLAFPIALAAAVWREIVAGRGLKNAPVALLISLFAFASLTDHLSGHFPVLDGSGIRLALGVAALMITLVGGRVTPSFTRNWMAREKFAPLPAPIDALDHLAIVATAVAIVGWIVAPDMPPTGAALLVAAALQVARLLRWRGHRTLREPIVLILHVGYLWLAAALALLGLAALVPSAVPIGSGIHALTAGAVGTMTLAVMTRASRGHTGQPLVADAPTVAIYALVTLGALLRVAAPLTGQHYPHLLVIGGALWASAFGLFALAYGPMLIRKRVAP